VAKAVSKLDEAPDEFGLCEECGEELLPARLKAMPYVELCVECQAKRDGPKGPRTRRNLYDYR
jgi:DnaK suppressor protein